MRRSEYSPQHVRPWPIARRPSQARARGRSRTMVLFRIISRRGLTPACVALATLVFACSGSNVVERGSVGPDGGSTVDATQSSEGGSWESDGGAPGDPEL